MLRAAMAMELALGIIAYWLRSDSVTLNRGHGIVLLRLVGAKRALSSGATTIQRRLPGQPSTPPRTYNAQTTSSRASDDAKAVVSNLRDASRRARKT